MGSSPTQKGSRCCRLFSALLFICLISAQNVSGSEVFVASGRDLARAVVDAAIQTIWLEQDIFMVEADWDGLGPFPRERSTNVTIKSANYHTMDLGFVQSKLRLGDRVVFKMERIVIQRYRLGNQLQAPGLDILELCAPRTHATVLTDDVYAVHRICFPPEVQVITMPLVPRPVTIPGPQRYRLAEPNPPDCTVNAADPAPRRCWAVRGVYVDIATPGADHASYGTVYPTEYDVHMVNMTYLCERVMPVECIQSLGYLGCAYNTLSHMDPPWQLAAGAGAVLGGGGGAANGSSSGAGGSGSTVIGRFPISGGGSGGNGAPVAGSDGSSSVGGSGGGSGSQTEAGAADGGGDGGGVNVGAIVGGVLGGVAFAALIAAAAVLVWRRRRQPPASPAAKAAATYAKQYNGGGGGSGGKAACPSCGKTILPHKQQQQQEPSLTDAGGEVHVDISTSGNVVSSWCGLQGATAAAAVNHSEPLQRPCPHCGASIVVTAGGGGGGCGSRAVADGDGDGGGGGGGRALSSKLMQGGSSSGAANVCVELQAQSTSTTTPVVQSLEARVESIMQDFAVAVDGGFEPGGGGGGALATASGVSNGAGVGGAAAVAPSQAAAAGTPLAALLAAAISTGVSVSSVAGVAGVGGAASGSQAHERYLANAIDGGPAAAAAAATPAHWSVLVPSVSSAGAAHSAPNSKNVVDVGGGGGPVAVASVAAAAGLGRMAAAAAGGSGAVSGRHESAAWLAAGGNTGGVSETALAAARVTGGGDGGDPASSSRHNYCTGLTDDQDMMASHIDMVVTPFTPARPDVNLSAVLLPYVSPANSAAALPSLPAAPPGQPQSQPPAAATEADPAAAAAVGAPAPQAVSAAGAGGGGAAAAAAAGARPAPASSLPVAAAAAAGADPLPAAVAAVAAAATAMDAGATVASGAGSGVVGGSPTVTPGGSIEGALIDCHVRLTNVVRGRGSFGKVVEGTYCGERVAVKLMRRTVEVEDCRAAAGGGGGGGGGGGAASRVVTAFKQEVEVLARLQHPNVVRLLAACMTPPRFCLVMELMETSLEGLLKAAPGRLLPLNAVMGIALDVARGLQYLHPTIVHRDLKPANVLVGDPLGPRQVAKLSDFGLARLRSSVVVTRNPEAGTPPYMAPECFDATATSLTHHVDAYSFGVLMWAMLSGQEPWAGLNCVSLAYRVAYGGERPPLDAIPPERRPPKLTRLIAQCWEADPKRRPAAAEIVKELLLVRQMFLRGMAVADMVDAPADSSGNYRGAAAAVAAAGVAAQGISQKRLLQPGVLATVGAAAAAELLGTERMEPERATAAVAAAQGGGAAAGAAVAAVPPSGSPPAAVLAGLRVPVPLGRRRGGGGSKPPAAAAAALTPEQVEEEAARMCENASLYRYGDQDDDDYLGYGRAWQLGSSWLAESPSATATASAANGAMSTAAAATTAAGTSGVQLGVTLPPQPQQQPQQQQQQQRP